MNIRILCLGILSLQDASGYGQAVLGAALASLRRQRGNILAASGVTSATAAE